MDTLFNKVLVENEKCVFYFYLKTEGTFWPTQYFSSNLIMNLLSNQDIFKEYIKIMLRKLKANIKTMKYVRN